MAYSHFFLPIDYTLNILYVQPTNMQKEKTQDSKVGDGKIFHNVPVSLCQIQYRQHSKRDVQNWQHQILLQLKHC